MRAGRTVAAALACGIVLASCSRIQVETLPGLSGRARVERITGGKPAEVPPDPRTANLPLSDVESSLRRIVVRYYGVTRWSKSEPRPLLSERQIAEFGAVMAAELPRLTVYQRLKFTFYASENGPYVTSMNVYREGVFLVYRFDALVLNEMGARYPGEPLRFGAELDAQPGQEVVNGDDVASVKDPLLEDQRKAAEEVAAKRALLDAALAERVATDDEKARLEPLMLRSAPSLDSWRKYWDKRRTLKKAFDENLMDRAAFQAQIDRLTSELER